MRRDFHNLYIHVPFCASKCGYCAFYSIPNPADEAVEAWLERLSAEFAKFAENTSELKSVFIGGGTPTLLSNDRLERLFKTISANFAVRTDAEISIECNPETLTTTKADVIAEFANRVSLGIQSFDARTLAVLERRGTPAQFAAAVDMLSERGVENLGCDLIYAVPGETLTTWLNDLLRAVESGVKHVSCYSLTIEEGTRLARRIKTPTSNSDDDLDAEMWELADTVLADAEMRRYEVSNHAIPVFDCRHNMEIWHGDTYLGCGPAAASFDGERRWINPANLADWLSGAEPEIDDIHPEERAAEILAIGFRTAEGWKDAKFAERTGFALDFRKNELANLAATGLLRISDDNSVVAPTSRGLALWDEIAERLIS